MILVGIPQTGGPQPDGPQPHSVWGRCLLVAVVLAFVIYGPDYGLAAPPEPQEVQIPMADGTLLATDVYLPPAAAAASPTPVPAIYLSGPYGKSGVRPWVEKFSKAGFAVVSQDMRGRGKSQGDNAPIFHHHGWSGNRDGHDTIRWIATQPWSDGQVATYGGSALGITQNMLAVDAPQALKAQYVEVAFSDMYSQCVWQGGALRGSLMRGWLQANGIVPGNLDLFLKHYKREPFWDELSPETFADRAHAPAVFLGGWYDIFLQGTINSFVELQHRGQDPARGNCRLVIGPWAHGTFDQLTYPENSGRQHVPAADFMRFYEHWLQGADNGVTEDLPVHYYVMGDPEDPQAPGNHWRAAADWPPEVSEVPYYLHADGTLSTASPSAASELSYRYDPANPVPTIGGQNLLLPKGPMDQREVEDRPDVLTFTTDPLSQPLEVTGRLRARLFISSDAPDTDFTVKLSDVYPDGRSMLVTDGVLRARFRNGFEQEELLEAGQVYELDIDLWSTSLVFNRGHRLRVAVSSSNSPRFEPNPNNGLAPTEPGEPRVATNTLYLSAEHPSAILLPVYHDETAE